VQTYNNFTTGPLAGARTLIQNDTFQAYNLFNSNSSTLNSTRLSVTDGTNTTTVSSTSVSTGTVNAGVGIATYAGPGLTNKTFGVDAATGNLFTVGTGTFGGLIKGSGGLGVTGGTTTDTLAVGGAALPATGAAIAGGLGVTGGTTSDWLKVTGLSTFGSVGQATIDASGNVTTSGTVSGNTVSAGAGGLTSSGGAKIDGVSTFTNTGTPGQGSTTVNGGLVTVTSPGNGSITLNGTVDPIVTISNAAASSTTTIIDGNINSTQTTGPTTGSTNINGAVTKIVGPDGGTFGTLTTDASGGNYVAVGLAGGTAGVAIVGPTGSNISGPNGTLITGPMGQTVTIASDGTNTGVNVQTATGSVGIGQKGASNPTGIVVANAASAPEFVANSTGFISAEGNRIQDVATPIVGTDAANKAYVDTSINRATNKAYEGTAVALAIEQPIFQNGQTFAIRAGWGDYEGQNAFGVSAAGLIAHNVLPRRLRRQPLPFLPSSRQPAKPARIHRQSQKAKAAPAYPALRSPSRRSRIMSLASPVTFSRERPVT